MTLVRTRNACLAGLLFLAAIGTGPTPVVGDSPEPLLPLSGEATVKDGDVLPIQLTFSPHALVACSGLGILASLAWLIEDSEGTGEGNVLFGISMNLPDGSVLRSEWLESRDGHPEAGAGETIPALETEVPLPGQTLVIRYEAESASDSETASFTVEGKECGPCDDALERLVCDMVDCIVDVPAQVASGLQRDEVECVANPELHKVRGATFYTAHYRDPTDGMTKLGCLGQITYVYGEHSETTSDSKLQYHHAEGSGGVRAGPVLIGASGTSEELTYQEHYHNLTHTGAIGFNWSYKCDGMWGIFVEAEGGVFREARSFYKVNGTESPATAECQYLGLAPGQDSCWADGTENVRPFQEWSAGRAGYENLMDGDAKLPPGIEVCWSPDRDPWVANESQTGLPLDPVVKPALNDGCWTLGIDFKINPDVVGQVRSNLGCTVPLTPGC